MKDIELTFDNGETVRVSLTDMRLAPAKKGSRSIYVNAVTSSGRIDKVLFATNIQSWMHRGEPASYSAMRKYVGYFKDPIVNPVE